MPAGPAPMTATRSGRSWRGLLPASDTAPSYRQETSWSSPPVTYCVMATTPPATSGALEQALFAPERVEAPASQLLRVRSVLPVPTDPAIAFHCRPVEYTPTFAPRPVRYAVMPSSVARLRASAADDPDCQVLLVSTSSHQL